MSEAPAHPWSLAHRASTVKVVAMLGCSGKDSDTGDTAATGIGGDGGGGGIPATAFDSAGWGCSTTNYWYDIYTTGISTGGWLYIFQDTASPWDEDHPLPVYESAADSSYTRLYLDLGIVYPDATAVVSGSTTLYSCADGNGMENTLNWVVEIDGADGENNIECVVWGTNPDNAPADDCARVNAATVAQLR